MPAIATAYGRALLGGARGNVPWTPFNLGALLVAYWDAANTASIVLNGGNVASWTDRKSGIVASQSTSGNQPAYTGGGLVFPSAGTRNLVVSGLPASSDFCIVAAPNVATSYRSMFTTSAGTVPVIINNNASNALGEFDGSFKQAGALAWSGAGVLYGSALSGVSYSMALNGGAAAAISSSYPSIADISIGTSAGSQGFGTIFDIVIAAQGLSTNNRNKLIGYEAWKYGLQSLVPGGFPFASRPPLVSDPS